MAHHGQPIPGIISYSYDATGSTDKRVRQWVLNNNFANIYNTSFVWRWAITWKMSYFIVKDLHVYWAYHIKEFSISFCLNFSAIIKTLLCSTVNFHHMTFKTFIAQEVWRVLLVVLLFYWILLTKLPSLIRKRHRMIALCFNT